MPGGRAMVLSASFADVLIFGGSAVAVRYGLVASVDALNLDGIDRFMLAVASLATALTGLIGCFGGLWLKRNDKQIKENQEKIDRLEKEVAEADHKVALAKVEADGKLAAAKADADAKLATHQDEIKILRDRWHKFTNKENTDNLRRAAEALPDRTLNVNVVNDPAHPIPVLPSHEDHEKGEQP